MVARQGVRTFWHFGARLSKTGEACRSSGVPGGMQDIPPRTRQTSRVAGILARRKRLKVTRQVFDESGKLARRDARVAFTYFFRDAQTLELLIEQALPSLRGRAFIRIWDAGCAHGPEPYTLAMLLREKMSDFVFRNVRIHATDVEPGFGQRIAAGIYAEREVKRIPERLRERYFEPANKPGHVRVVDAIREKITFAEHDLLGLSPPREDFSLIVCKNVLLHFDEEHRRRVLRMFHRALRPGGLLATEHTQKLPARVARLFETISRQAQIHRRVEIAGDTRTYLDGPHELAGQPAEEAGTSQVLPGRKKSGLFSPFFMR